MLMDPEVDALGLNATLGVNWTNLEFEVGGMGSDEESAFRLFGGLEAAFANNLTLAAELQMKEEDIGDADMLWSIVGRYQFNDALALQVGYTNASMIDLGTGFNGGENSNFFAGLSYAFGIGGEDDDWGY